MQSPMNEAMFEFAMTCQYVIKQGWEFVEINYREDKFGGPFLIIKKGDETRAIYNYWELDGING